MAVGLSSLDKPGRPDYRPRRRDSSMVLSIPHGSIAEPRRVECTVVQVASRTDLVGHDPCVRCSNLCCVPRPQVVSPSRTLQHMRQLPSLVVPKATDDPVTTDDLGRCRRWGPAVVPPDTAGAPANTSPPSRRAAILRPVSSSASSAIVLLVILPRYIDYQEVIACSRPHRPADPPRIRDRVIALGSRPEPSSALIPGLSWPGTEAWLILAGIGASILLGPWNMAVLCGHPRLGRGARRRRVCRPVRALRSTEPACDGTSARSS
jgi:hypothetical protein